ncbi:MAG: hypothetical protein K9J25_03600 [Bacteroidales bacterium]|nr:hypothetical protein [Bacteroidales bacterium]
MEKVIYNETGKSHQKVRILVSDTTFFGDRIKPKKELQFIAVRVINNDSLPFAINNSSITVFNDFEPVEIIPYSEYYKKIKYKSTAYYIIGSAGILMSLGISNHGLHPSFKNPGWILTLGTGGYFYAAAKANKKLKKDLLTYDLNNMKTDPGTEVSGFLCISSKTLNNLSIRIE